MTTDQHTEPEMDNQKNERKSFARYRSYNNQESSSYLLHKPVNASFLA